MRPRQGNARLRRLAAICAIVAAFVAACAPAYADEWTRPTTQAVAYNAEWVPYLDPPEKPAAVCLVDSGVNITPDTPADSPEGPIVKRLALDGGPGTAASDTWEGLHGTRMAFVGAAPINGWGAVGFWPGARIVSIRAMPMGATSFPFDAYSRAMATCRKWAPTYRLVAVNLSIACTCDPSAAERARLANEITLDHSQDLSVVAAVGNGSSRIGSPAAGEGVMAIAAGDQHGALCSFSNRGEGVDLVAPGCDIDLASTDDGQLWRTYQSGTSGASVTTAVALALLRSYRPDLSWQTAEQLLTHSANSTADGPRLNVERLFRRAGLGDLVDRANERLLEASPASAPGSPRTLGAEAPESRPAGPRFRPAPAMTGPAHPRVAARAPRLRSILRVGRRLTVTVRNRPRGSFLSVTVERRRGEFGYASLCYGRRMADALRVTLPGRATGAMRVRVQFLAPSTLTPSRSVSRRMRV